MSNEDKKEETGSTPEKKGKNYILKFITGKFTGGAFNLPYEGELIIGRGSDTNITISEDNVSRRHAKLTITNGNHIYIEDLGSTNGTFLNGERITKATVKEGDRILIGTSMLKLIAIQDEAKPSRRITANGFRTTVPTAEATSIWRLSFKETSQPQRVLEGSLNEIPITDVIQMCSSTKKSGVLTLEWEKKSAEIYIKGGNIIYSAYKDIYDMPARKVFYRLLGLHEGKFSLLQYVEPPEFAELIEEPTEFLIMEGIRRLDEQKAIESEEKLRGSRFQFSFPLSSPLKKLNEAELDIFQLLYNPVPYELLLDMSPYDDLETAQIIKKLLDKKYIKKV